MKSSTASLAIVRERTNKSGPRYVIRSPTFSWGISCVRAVRRKNIFRKNLNWLNRTTGTKVTRLYLVFFMKLRCRLGGETCPLRVIVLLHV